MCKKIYKYINIIYINYNMNKPTISPMYILLIKKIARKSLIACLVYFICNLIFIPKNKLVD
jgi:hypothetical protein